MSVKIVIGLDGTDTGERALAFAKDLAAKMDACELIAIYVIEWSPFTFQTAEENAQRHKRREDEIALATSRIVDPAVASLTLTVEHGASQIIVGRGSSDGFAKRIFGSSTQSLVMHADVPVTVVG